MPLGSVAEKRGLIYKEMAGTKLTADFFYPAGAGLHPAVIVVHGGGWTSRTGSMEWICQRIAQAGFVAINITYRLAPESHFPKPVEDVRDALKWLRAHNREHEIDSGRIAGWGYSAGANILLLAGLDSELGFKALVAGGTPANLSGWPKSSQVKAYLGTEQQQDPARWEAASPVNKVSSGSPPVFLYHGSWDWIVRLEQMRMMEKALKTKGVAVESYVSPYMGHLLTYLISQESVQRGIRFLQERL
jgi:acetyl esterase/lipase